MYPGKGYIMYRVLLAGKVNSGLKRLRKAERSKVVRLIKDLMAFGPIRKDWKNFSALGKNRYHCHLSHKWVVCWRVMKTEKIIEVYYAGSRENAPY